MTAYNAYRPDNLKQTNISNVMSIMVIVHPSIMIVIILLTLAVHAFALNETQFIYNGFQGSINELHVDGLAAILPNGVLQMTDYSKRNTSHAFYPHPLNFRPSHLSFSTTFVFAMYPEIPHISGHGITFVISQSIYFKHTLPHAYLGLFNPSTNGLSSNHVFAVELDTIQNADMKDIDGNHVGIDVNSLISDAAAPAAYYSDKDKVNKTLLLNSGKAMQIWIDYDEVEMLVNVTLGPFRHPKPSKCLLSHQINLSAIFLDTMYVGFTSATGNTANFHSILGWSWNQSGKAQDLDPSKLPSLPRFKHHKKSLNSIIFAILLIIVILLLLMIIVVAAWFRWRKKYEELLEPWEKEYSPNRFSYRDLFVATKGFKSSELLGVGGFGKVYKGVLPSTRDLVAVKRVSHDSKQGMKEFITEISSMRRLRHKNLVQLLGYCRRKDELLLVYEFMPNQSLDKFLFGKDDKSVLYWCWRFKIIKGMASALVYLHEGWEQVVLHRDVKASNVLLDAEMNARLGDFGLARLYDRHNNDPRTTNVVGTIGYIAPEISITQKPTTSSDVFAFGMFLLEVGCGRRPIGKHYDADAEDFFLSDWVYDCWKEGQILNTSDPRLEGDYQQKEMELVLKLGLLCLHPNAEERPTMRQVVQFLDGSATLPEIPSDYDIKGVSSFMDTWGKSGLLPSSSGTASVGLMSSINSALQYGR